MNWESWIGRTTTSQAWLDPAQADRMAVTLDREPSYAEGDPLPPAWHWLYFHDVVRASELGEEGHPALGVTMPPVPLPRRMWAGGTLELDGPLRLGERAERTSVVSDVVPKQGASGSLYFVTVRHDVSTDGEVRLREQQTIVYREMEPSGGTAAAPTAPTEPELTRRWQLDSTALFRYSALTFNGHRIHYDVDYARDVEGYPDLVIHGPLLATLLLDLAHTHGHAVRRFRYRARSPLFLPAPFVVAGRAADDGLALWAAAEDGRLAMEASASL